jgi:hypothetical protein
VDVAHEIGAAWEEIASALEAFEDAGKSDAGISRAKARLADALRRRWQHELGCAHDVLAPKNDVPVLKEEDDEPVPEPTSLDAAILRTEP